MPIRNAPSSNGGSKRSRVAPRNTRRSMRNSKRSVRNKTTVDAGLGFPKQMKMIHKYCDTMSIQSTAGALTRQRFSCNGMYDPDKTNIGHQPLYFDQMAALYNHYTVIGSKITVTFAAPPSSAPAIMVAIMQDDDQTNNLTAMSEVLEQSLTTSRLMNPGVDNNIVLANNWSAKKTFGGSVLGNDELQGNASANPTETTEWNIFVQTSDQVTTSYVVANVTIEFIAIWDELKERTGS